MTISFLRKVVLLFRSITWSNQTDVAKGFSNFGSDKFGKENDQLTNCLLENTPKCYEPANLIGLKLLLRLGLHLNN